MSREIEKASEQCGEICMDDYTTERVIKSFYGDTLSGFTHEQMLGILRFMQNAYILGYKQAQGKMRKAMGV